MAKRSHTQEAIPAGISSTGARLFLFIREHGHAHQVEAGATKTRHEGLGFHSIATVEIVPAAARGVQDGFSTEPIGFAYRLPFRGARTGA